MRFFSILIFLTFFCLLLIVALAPSSVQGLEIKNPLKYDEIEEIIPAITELLKGIAITLGTVLVIWGGIQIMTAGGNEEKLTKGKKTITWTVIGVAIVILVDFIVGFIKELLGVQ